MMRIIRAAEQVAYRTAAPTRMYRGLNLDTTAPGMEKVHGILNSPGGWDHPDVGDHILDWLKSGPRQGLGTHWTADPKQAEQFARWPNEHTGRGGNLQAIVQGDWHGESEDHGRTDTHEFDESGNRIREFPDEQETTLHPGAGLDVTGLRIRPYDDEYWNGPSDGSDVDSEHDGPWHEVFSGSRPHTAKTISPNLSNYGEPWFAYDDQGALSHEHEMFIPHPQFVHNQEQRAGWLEGEPAQAGPGDERQWREIKFKPERGFYHPDTDEDAGEYEWAHARPDKRMLVSSEPMDMDNLTWDWDKGKWVPRRDPEAPLIPERQERTFDYDRNWPGWRGASSLSDEDRISVAEQTMERGGHAGQHFHVPSATVKDAEARGLQFHETHQLQRQHSAEAEKFVNGVLGDHGWDGGHVRVEPRHWDLRQPGSGQAVTDGGSFIGLAGNDTNAMTLLHETAHILNGEPEGGHGPGFHQGVHGLYHKYLGPEAANTFARIMWPDRGSS